MKRLFLLLLVVSFCTVSVYLNADDDFVITRVKTAVEGRYKALKSTGLIDPLGATETGVSVLSSLTTPINIYRIYITSIAATSTVGIWDEEYDSALADSNCVFEIFEATNGAGYYLDFGDDPIRIETALSVRAVDANVVIHYR